MTVFLKTLYVLFFIEIGTRIVHVTGATTNPDGTFVTTTYGHWTEGEPPYIVSVRFKLAELDGKLKR